MTVTDAIWPPYADFGPNWMSWWIIRDIRNGLGAGHEPGCVGYRDDLGGTLEMAELVRSVLGAGYYIGDCTLGGFPINVHVIE